jgi:hypothetical protein
MMVLLVSLGGMFVCSFGAELGDGLLILWSRYISFLSAETRYEGSLSFWSNLGGGSLSMMTAIHIRFDSARSPISPGAHIIILLINSLSALEVHGQVGFSLRPHFLAAR